MDSLLELRTEDRRREEAPGILLEGQTLHRTHILRLGAAVQLGVVRHIHHIHLLQGVLLEVLRTVEISTHSSTKSKKTYTAVRHCCKS